MKNFLLLIFLITLSVFITGCAGDEKSGSKSKSSSSDKQSQQSASDEEIFAALESDEALRDLEKENDGPITLSQSQQEDFIIANLQSTYKDTGADLSLWTAKCPAGDMEIEFGQETKTCTMTDGQGGGGKADIIVFGSQANPPVVVKLKK